MKHSLHMKTFSVRFNIIYYAILEELVREPKHETDELSLIRRLQTSLLPKLQTHLKSEHIGRETLTFAVYRG